MNYDETAQIDEVEKPTLNAHHDILAAPWLAFPNVSSRLKVLNL